MQVTVGQQATRSLTVTEEGVRAFAEMTGDYNPLHFDEAFAAGAKSQVQVPLHSEALDCSLRR